MTGRPSAYTWWRSPDHQLRMAQLAMSCDQCTRHEIEALAGWAQNQKLGTLWKPAFLPMARYHLALDHIRRHPLIWC